MSDGAPHAALDRIWGTVRTASGGRFEGFLVFDHDKASWVDILDGAKVLAPDARDAVAALLGDDTVERGRSVEFLGVRISWDDDGGPDGATSSGIRFGHVAWLRPSADRTALLGLVSGAELELRTPIGLIHVDNLEHGAREIAWDQVERIDFEAAPGDARPTAARLHGTVEDRWGDRWTGDLIWDRDKAFTDDVLDGSIRFSAVEMIEPRFSGGARVVLRDGTESVLRGRGDVDPRHGGVRIADPALGEISVDWRDVVRVRLTPAIVGAGAGYHDFEGGRLLGGAVETSDGLRFEGRILWDADEARSWELLDGSARGIGFRIEFGRIASIARHSSRSSEVTLTDGRTIVLEGSNDVNRDNKGIVVELSDGTVQVVAWDRFERATFARD